MGTEAPAPLLDLYDTEILAAERVLHKLNERTEKPLNLEAFRNEVIERFADIGLVVNVKVWETNQDGRYAFDLEIIGRTEAVTWDPDRQVHEVTNDVLELLPPSERGQVIKTTKPAETPTHKH